MVSLGGMVVYNIEDDFYPGYMEGPDHPFKFVHHIHGSRPITVYRSKEGQAVVAPIIVQTLAYKIVIVDIVVNREEFDGCDAQAGKVLDDGL